MREGWLLFIIGLVVALPSVALSQEAQCAFSFDASAGSYRVRAQMPDQEGIAQLCLVTEGSEVHFACAPATPGQELELTVEAGLTARNVLVRAVSVDEEGDVSEPSADCQEVHLRPLAPTLLSVSPTTNP